MASTQPKSDLVALDAAITRVHGTVIACILAILLVYVTWFWGIRAMTLADRSDAWGQFGDFVGGVLNPLVAYAAFYWLTRAVRLQKEELLETREALKQSSESQSKQAEYAGVSVRVSALTALINSIMVEVQTQRMQLQFIIDQLDSNQGGSAWGLDGTMLSGTDLRKHIETLNANISRRMTERYTFEEELKALLK